MITGLLSRSALRYRARARKTLPEKNSRSAHEIKHCLIGSPPGSCARKQKHCPRKNISGRSQAGHAQDGIPEMPERLIYQSFSTILSDSGVSKSPKDLPLRGRFFALRTKRKHWGAPGSCARARKKTLPRKNSAGCARNKKHLRVFGSPGACARRTVNWLSNSRALNPYKHVSRGTTFSGKAHFDGSPLETDF